MPAVTYTLFPSSSGADWKIARVGGRTCEWSRVDVAAASGSEHRATLISDAVKRLGYRGEPVCLAVPSDWCLSAPVRVTELPPKNRRPLMVYAMEEQLPIPAEELVIDFIAAQAVCLGVAVAVDRVEPLVNAMETAGLSITQICPAAILVLQAVVVPGDPATLLIVETGGAVEVFSTSGAGLPTSWRSFETASVSSLPSELRFRSLDQNPPVRIRTCLADSATPIRALCGLTGVEVSVEPDPPPQERAAAVADQILRGERAAWINLRRDALAAVDPLRAIRVPLNWAVAATLTLSVCLALAMFWRAAQYERLAAAFQDEQAAAYRQALPGRPVPVNVKSRLVSEEKKLRGISGGADELPARPSALSTMYLVIRALPRNVRFQLSELRFQGDRAFLEGAARSHGDADGVASSLREAGRFEVDAPQSEQRADGSVVFSVSARHNASPAAVASGGTSR